MGMDVDAPEARPSLNIEPSRRGQTWSWPWERAL